VSLKRIVSRKSGITSRASVVMAIKRRGVFRVFCDVMAFERRRRGEILIAMLTVLHRISVDCRSRIVERDSARTGLKATMRREDDCSIGERVCVFPQDGRRSLHVSTSFVVVAKTHATESKIWIDFGSFREGAIVAGQEAGGEPPTFDDFGHAGEAE
jgi:hypothetical protein